jgi:Zn-dependent peptidase ImmA (M78 family)
VNNLTNSEKILQNLGITEPEEIDLETIAWTQKVRIKRRLLNGCEARIIGTKDTAIISVDSRVNPKRQRFSIAHELGHWNNDRGQNYFCSSDDIQSNFRNSKFAEKMANRFAANLLLPDYLLMPIIRKCPYFTWEVIKKVASKFRTSLTAAAIRMIESNEFPAILLSYVEEKRKWFIRVPQIPERWFPKDCLEPDSIAYKIMEGKESFSKDPFDVSADTWFDYQENDEYEVSEQSIRVTENEVLSIIVFDDERMLEENVF